MIRQKLYNQFCKKGINYHCKKTYILLLHMHNQLSFGKNV